MKSTTQSRLLFRSGDLFQTLLIIVDTTMV